ncbi:trypsin-like peptidase domain-containing protein [soil metagenome]
MNDQPSFPPPEGNPYEAQPPTPQPFDSAPQPAFQEFAPPSFPPPVGPPAGVPTGAPSWQDQNPYATQVLPVQTRPGADKPRGRKGFAVGVLTAALLVGGGAGLGGAALYSSQHDDGSSGSAAAPGTRQVVSTPAQPAADGSVEQVAAAVLPSVVKLDVSNASEAGSGSGIILSSDGQILTNNHVAAVAGEGGKITVSFSDGSHAPAHIVGTDPLTDTAVVQAEGVSGLTPATIGQSSNVAVGEQVVAIGSPFGLDATVTSGIVSALARPVNVGTDAENNATVYPAIQTDAAINPGNSGGPLVDLDGHVIGINSSIQSTSTTGGEAGSIGLGFAIPIDEVLPVVDQMKNGETPTHAKLGVSVENVGTGVEVADGAQIRTIGDGSAAGSAGLQAGDIITKVDDTLITGSDSLVATVRSYRPGDKVTLTYTRDGKESTTTLELGSDADGSNS